MRALLKKLLPSVILAMLHEQVPGVCATPIKFIGGGFLAAKPEETFIYETNTMGEVFQWIKGEVERQLATRQTTRNNGFFLSVTCRGAPFLFDPNTIGVNAHLKTDLSLTIKQHMERERQLAPVVSNFRGGKMPPILIVNHNDSIAAALEGVAEELRAPAGKRRREEPA
ncbi:unnamed protein product [Amoebophrya sp. A120]|nr:unnamed protein product [Amoebophrya sp. A120]|eukprot:GSA120T00003479001.1